ncbi:MAG: Na+/H+ antiporter subunit E [Phycisphaeraceae bacterium]
MNQPSQNQAEPKKVGTFVWFLQTAGTLIAIWVLLSGKFDLLHLGLGVVGSLLLTASFMRTRQGKPFPFLRFFAFVPWHLWQVAISNLRVSKVAISPQPKIQPSFIERDPLVHSDRALTVLGCAVTLTPGTLTVEIEPGRYLVHALDDLSAQDIEQDVMAKRVAQVFGELPGGAADADGRGAR